MRKIITEKEGNSMKKTLKIWLIVLSVLTVISCLAFTVLAVSGEKTEPGQISEPILGDANGDGSVDVADLVAMRYYFANSDFYEDEVESLGLLELNNGIELRVNSDGSFKVLILSDVQCYDAEGIVNSGTLDIIEAMLEKEDPDLVLFLGDNSWSCNTAEKLRA